MPNWCECRMVISGPKKDIANLLGQSEKYPQYYVEHDMIPEEKTVFCFSGTVPIPEEILISGECLDWTRENWGTKWDIQVAPERMSVNDKSGEEYTVFLDFESAWSPPIEWMKRCSSLFPSLLFDIDFFEPGMNFSGEFKVKNGEILTDVFNS